MEPENSDNMPPVTPVSAPPIPEMPEAPPLVPQEPSAPIPQAPPSQPEPLATESSVTPPSESSGTSSKKKLFIVIGAVVILLILVAVGIFAFTKIRKPAEQVMEEPSPTPEAMMEDEVNGWKTYNNENFSFTFKYPSDLAILSEYTSTVSPTDITPTEHIVEFGEEGKNKMVAALYIQPNIKEINTEKEITNISAGEHMFKSYDGFYKNALATYYSIVKNNNIYSLVLINFTNVIGADTTSIYDKANQILSTFEFVGSQFDTGEISKESEWLTYQGTGFSFKYPKEFGQLTKRVDVRTINITNTAVAHQSLFDIKTQNYSGTMQLTVSDDYSEPIATTLKDWVEANTNEGSDGSGLNSTNKQTELPKSKIGFINSGTQLDSNVPELNILYFDINGKVYSIELYLPFDLNFHENYSDLFKNIMSTLEFN